MEIPFLNEPPRNPRWFGVSLDDRSLMNELVSNSYKFTHCSRNQSQHLRHLPLRLRHPEFAGEELGEEGVAQLCKAFNFARA